MQASDEATSSVFKRDGYAVLKGLLNSDEVAGIRASVNLLRKSPSGFACRRPHNTLLPFRWKDSINNIVRASSHFLPTLRQAIAADDLKWISGYVSIKEPRSPALWWHQDWWCWDHPMSFQLASPQVAVLSYLNKTCAGNGALRVLPGSHHRSLPIHAFLPATGAHPVPDVALDHVSMSNHADQVTLGLSAGDAVVIDYRLLHGTHGNASGIPRDCIILNFVPSWSDLPAEIKGHLICHPALPSPAELSNLAFAEREIFPAFSGTRRDLALNRAAPPVFDCRS